MPWSQKGVGDGREGDRPVSRTIADGCQGLASAADYGAHAPGAGTLARRLAAGPGVDRIGYGGGTGRGSPYHRPVGRRIRGGGGAGLPP